MSNLEAILEQAIERLAGDEQWRSNLNDDEARLLLDWAIEQLTARAAAFDDSALDEMRVYLKQEAQRVRRALRNLNDLLADDQLPETSAACAAIDRPAPPDPIAPWPDRLALLRWLVA